MPETIGIKFSTGKEIELTEEELSELISLRNHKLTWSIEDTETGEEIMNIPLVKHPSLDDARCAEFKITVSDNLKGVCE